MNIIEFGDCREIMIKWHKFGFKSQMCVTSPPYFGLRNYGHDGQIGLEKTPEEYIAALVDVFRCVRNMLEDDGTLWLNLGDSYGSGKQLFGIPWRVALALQDDGWILRQDIIWNKPNPMPESVTDRCTKAHEYIFLLSKNERYFYDSESIKEPAKVSSKGIRFGGSKYGDSNDPKYATKSGNISKEYDKANKRSVWQVSTVPYKGAHFATFPPALIEPCILAGSRPGDIVLDPFMGSGTTAMVAHNLGRQYMGCELNPEYESLQIKRLT